MNADNYFREALKYKIKEEGVTQKEINEALNLPRTQLSAYLREESGFSESRKELLSEYFEMSFIDMLLLGRELVEGTPAQQGEIPGSEPVSKDDPSHLKELIKDMQWLINVQKEELERKTEDIKDLKEENQEYKEENRRLRELEQAKSGVLKKDAS